METGKLRISLIHYPVYVLGPGRRVVIWTQGCSIRCRGCISKHTWSFEDGTVISIQELSEFLNKLPYDRLTISGGEPFDQSEALLELLKKIRKYFSDILIYTGYKMEDIRERFKEHLLLIDALVDGEFVEGWESPYAYKGSDNQRLFILNKNLFECYQEWSKLQERSLQVIEKDGKIYVVGIPFQKDAKRLNYGI